MATSIELAVFSYNAYNPSLANEIGLTDWTTDPLSASNSGTGFAASVYKNGDEVVIAFRGTNAQSLGQLVTDFYTGNIPAAFGWESRQVRDAIHLIADVMAQYPQADITLTGHSLGGGLAQLMAAFFDLDAVVFDPAPFGLTAQGLSAQVQFNPIPTLPPIVIGIGPSNTLSQYFQEYVNYQFAQGRPLAISQLFQEYVEDVEGGGDAKAQMLQQRIQNVTGYYLEGEALAGLRALPGFQTFSLPLTQVLIGETTLNDSMNLFEAIDLHGMALLTAMMASTSLQNASARLPTLLEMLLSRDLYAREDVAVAPVNDETSFLNRLLRDQLASDGSALTRFAQDLLQLGSEGTTHLTGLRDGLIATIIEYYNYADLADTQPFVNPGSNGAVLDLSRIPAIPLANPSDKRGQQRLIAGLEQILDPMNRARARQWASNAAVWTVQTGANALYTSGREENEVQIGGVTQHNVLNGGAGDDLLVDGHGNGELNGGVGNDVLLGGSGDDLLYGGVAGDLDAHSDDDYLHGGAGNDILIGGRGRDELRGGADNDTYMLFLGDGADTIVDYEGEDRIFVEGEQVLVGERIAANTWRSADGQLTIQRQSLSTHQSPSRFNLIIRDAAGSLVITVRDWQMGQLGIVLTFGDYPEAGETAGDVVPVTPTAGWQVQRFQIAA